MTPTSKQSIEPPVSAPVDATAHDLAQAMDVQAPTELASKETKEEGMTVWMPDS